MYGTGLFAAGSVCFDKAELESLLAVAIVSFVLTFVIKGKR